MHGHKNIPSANPLFSGIIMAHPILHISTIRVKGTLLALAYLHNSADCQFTALALALTVIKSWHAQFQNSVISKLISLSFLLDGYLQDLLV